MPGKYTEPQGRILLAEEGDSVAGICALRPLDDEGICELKRLYVREPWRGRGLGRRLSVALIDYARARGYAAVRLDTEKRLEAAIALYRDLGFAEIGAYYDNPLADILYFELELN